MNFKLHQQPYFVRKMVREFERGKTMMKSPCMNCPDRRLYCHSGCVDYITYQNKRKEEKAQISEAKIADGEYWAVRKHSKERALRARGERKG